MSSKSGLCNWMKWTGGCSSKSQRIVRKRNLKAYITKTDPVHSKITVIDLIKVLDPKAKSRLIRNQASLKKNQIRSNSRRASTLTLWRRLLSNNFQLSWITSKWCRRRTTQIDNIQVLVWALPSKIPKVAIWWKFKPIKCDTRRRACKSLTVCK